MIPHLRTFIDAIESAAGKRECEELTDVEKIALCIGCGVAVDVDTSSTARSPIFEWVQLVTKVPVRFEHDGGNWQVIELK